MTADLLLIPVAVIVALWLGNNFSSCIVLPPESETWEKHPECLSGYLKWRKWWFDHSLEPMLVAGTLFIWWVLVQVVFG